MSPRRDLCTPTLPRPERSPTRPASPPKAMDASGRCRPGADGLACSAGASGGHQHPLARLGPAPLATWPPPHAGRGGPTTAIHRCLGGSPAPLHRAGSAAPRWPLPSQARLPAPGLGRCPGAPTPGQRPALPRPTRPGLPGRLLPGAATARASPPHPASLGADSRRTGRPGGLPAPPALAPGAPWHRSAARSAHTRGALPARVPRALHPSGPPQGTSTARPSPLAPPPAQPWRPMAATGPSPPTQRRPAGAPRHLHLPPTRPPVHAPPASTSCVAAPLPPPGLPAGGMQGCPCGWMHAPGRLTTATIRPRSTAPPGAPRPLEPPRCPATTPAPGTWPHCGAPRIVLRRVWPLPLALFDTSDAHDLATSLTWSRLRWPEPEDGTAASEARDNALPGHCGAAAHGAPSPYGVAPPAHRVPSKPEHPALCLAHHPPFAARPSRP